jgi:hypothetical protein
MPSQQLASLYFPLSCLIMGADKSGELLDTYSRYGINVDSKHGNVAEAADRAGS